jgi:dTDP-4-dehydrorhamnose 3,5-epimerase-like enzyme
VTNELLPGCRLMKFAVKGDARGRLVAIEGTRDAPFAIARVYYVYATTPGTVRGLHAHRSLNQLAVAVAGSCDMLLDDGRERVTLRLDDPATALTLPPMVWHEMSDFSPDCVLMVLADAPYDESDYIRDYGAFVALAQA